MINQMLLKSHMVLYCCDLLHLKTLVEKVVQLCEDNISSYFEHSDVILDILVMKESGSISSKESGSSKKMALSLENGTKIQNITAIEHPKDN